MRQVRRRRLLIAMAALFAAPPAMPAEPQGKIPRIGFLIAETVPGTAGRIEAMRAGLRERGYVEGRNVVIDIRAADGTYERLPDLAENLVLLKADVIVAFGSKAVAAAKRATTTVPIVVPSSTDPVAMGYIKGLAQPGGNITGLAMMSTDLIIKRMELLKECVPRIKRLASISNPANASSTLALEVMRANAAQLKLDLKPFEARAAKDFDNMFSAIAKAHVDAALVSQDTLFRAHFKELAALAAKHRIPSAGAKEYAEAGGLIGYSADDAELFRRGAYFVDRILKGAKPSELPVERPMRFELVVNQKTAKALGITIPQSVLIRADRVIE
jgi:putative ABC transport system substrate-binding protein